MEKWNGKKQIHLGEGRDERPLTMSLRTRMGLALQESRSERRQTFYASSQVLVPRCLHMHVFYHSSLRVGGEGVPVMMEVGGRVAGVSRRPLWYVICIDSTLNY